MNTAPGENNQPKRPSTPEVAAAINNVVNSAVAAGVPLDEVLKVLELSKLDVYWAMRKQVAQASPRIFRAGPGLPPGLDGRPS